MRCIERRRRGMFQCGKTNNLSPWASEAERRDWGKDLAKIQESTGKRENK